ncbi:MAG: hypothetical protein LDL41_07525 [Coleofasciculus sp. S288]|nr:hypothetical protein [Coleofasciculus sp. S288]
MNTEERLKELANRPAIKRAEATLSMIEIQIREIKERGDSMTDSQMADRYSLISILALEISRRYLREIKAKDPDIKPIDLSQLTNS